MSMLPGAVSDYLIELATQNRSLAYLETTPTGQLISWNGSLQKYGLTNLHKGHYIGDYLFYLDGLFPFSSAHEVIPQIHIEQNLIIDVHLISSKLSAQDSHHSNADSKNKWVLILDKTNETRQQQQLIQIGNELNLLQHQYRKLLKSCSAKQAKPS